MYVYLSKILPPFVMPVAVAILLCIGALVLLRAEHRKTAGGLVAGAVVVLWISSTPIVANSLYGFLEQRYPPVPLARVPQSGCMVVLGGAVSPAQAPRVDVELNGAVDRVLKTAQLYRHGKAPVVIVAAGNQPWSESSWAEAELIRDLLMKWGVPKMAILLEGSSRNTRENAIYTRNIVNAIACERALLVTSAAHMPRAMAAFQSANVSVFPVATDVRVVERTGLTVFDFLPDAHALAMTSDAIREWIGQWVYRFQGWG